MSKEPTRSYDKNDDPKTGSKPAGKSAAVAATEEEIGKAIAGAVEGFKGRADKTSVVNALRTAAELLNRNDDWAAKDPAATD